MSDNNIYDDNSFGTSAAVATMGLVGMAGWMAINDKKGLDSIIASMINKLAPETENKLTKIEDIYWAGRDAASGTSSIVAAKRRAKLAAIRERSSHSRGNITTSAINKVSVQNVQEKLTVLRYSNIDITSDFLIGRKYNLANNQVNNAFGARLDFEQEIRKSFRDTSSDISFSYGSASLGPDGGTYADVTIGKEKMRFNFGVYNEETGAMVHRTGRRLNTQMPIMYLEPGFDAATQDTGKKFNISKTQAVIYDANSYKMRMINNDVMQNEVIASSGAMDIEIFLKKLARSDEGAAAGLLSSMKKDGSIYNAIKTSIGAMDKAKKLKLALEIIDEQNSQYSVHGGNVEMAKQGMIIGIDPYSLKEFEREADLPGLATSHFSITPGRSSTIEGANKIELYNIINSLNPANIRIAGATSTINMSGPLGQFGSMGAISSQTQVAENMLMSALGLPFPQSAEALKSVGIPMYSRLPGGKQSIITKAKEAARDKAQEELETLNKELYGTDFKGMSSNNAKAEREKVFIRDYGSSKEEVLSEKDSLLKTLGELKENKKQAIENLTTGNQELDRLYSSKHDLYMEISNLDVMHKNPKTGRLEVFPLEIAAGVKLQVIRDKIIELDARIAGEKDVQVRNTLISKRKKVLSLYNSETNKMRKYAKTAHFLEDSEKEKYRSLLGNIRQVTKEIATKKASQPNIKAIQDNIVKTREALKIKETILEPIIGIKKALNKRNQAEQELRAAREADIGLRAIPNVITSVIHDNLTRPMNQIDRNGMFTGMAGLYNAMTGFGGQEQSNMINMFGVIDYATHPVGRDFISLAHTYKATVKGTVSIDHLVDEATYTIRKIQANGTLARATTNSGTDRLSNIFDPKYWGQDQDFIIADDEVIFFKKGTAIGTREQAMQVLGDDAARDLFEIDKGIVRLKADAYLTKQDILETMSRSTDNTRGIQLALRWQDDVSKVAMDAGQARSSVTKLSEAERDRVIFGIEGIDKDVEFTVGHKLFSKTGPKITETGAIKQKEAAYYMSHLQDRLKGQLYFSKAQQLQQSQQYREIILEGNEAISAFTGMLTQKSRDAVAALKGNGSRVSLTEAMFTEGGLHFQQALHSQSEYAKQLSGMISLYGQIREQYAKDGTTPIVVNKIHTESKDSAEVGRLFDVLTEQTETAERVHTSRFLGKNDVFTEAEERAAFHPVFSGIHAMEVQTFAQGPAMNDLRIHARYSHQFFGRENILNELAGRSTVDVEKLTLERELMRLSMANDRQGYDALLSTYESKYGDIPVIDSIEQVNSILGGELASVSSLRDPSQIPHNFLGEATNQHGFRINVEGGGTLHIPSATALGHATMIDDTTATFSEHAANIFKTIERLRTSTSDDPSLVQLSREAFNNFRASSGIGLQSMLFKASKITIPEAIYAQHRSASDFVGSQWYSQMLEYEKEMGAVSNISALTNRLGQSSVVSRHTYEQIVHSHLKTLMDKDILGQDEGIKAFLGEDDYNTLLGAVDNPEDYGQLAGELAVKKTEEAANALKETERLVKGMLDKRISNTQITEEEISNILTQIEKDWSAGLTVRPPSIYYTSPMGSYIAVSDTLSELETRQDGTTTSKRNKTVSVGHLSAIGKNTDYDGDAYPVTLLFGKTSREDVKKAQDTIQKYSIEYMDAYKNNNVFDTVFKEKSVIGQGLHLEAFSQALLGEHQVETAIGAFMTKALTGSVNMKALGLKSVIFDALLENKHNESLTEEAAKKIFAWGESISSLFTEQDIISSKKFQVMYDSAKTNAGQGSTITQVMEMLQSNVTHDDIRELLIESKGRPGPVPLFLLAQKKGMKGTSAAFNTVMQDVETMMNMQLNLSAVTEDAFNRLRDYMQPLQPNTAYTAAQDAEWIARWDKYKETIKKNKPLLDLPEFKIIKSTFEDNGIIGVISQAMKKTPGLNMASVIEEAYNTVKDKLGSGSNVENADLLLDEVFSSIVNRIMDQNSKIFFGSDEMTNLRPRVSRGIAGWAEVKNVFSDMANWVKQDPLYRSAGLAAMGIAGITAINLISGDGSISDPNDLPSVNTPAMGAQRDHMMDSSAMNSYYNYNASGSYQTVGAARYEGITTRFADFIGMSGYNTVTIKSDGSNPYQQDMAYYR